MRINELKNKWNGKVINNINLKALEAEYSNDLKDTFKMLARKANAELIEFNVNEDYVNGYVLKNGRLIYFNYLLKEDEAINLNDDSWSGGILLRNVKDLNDFVGGPASYTNFDGLVSEINTLVK